MVEIVDDHLLSDPIKSTRYDSDAIIVVETEESLRYVFSYSILVEEVTFSHVYNPKNVAGERRAHYLFGLPEEIEEFIKEKYGSLTYGESMLPQAKDNQRAVQ